MSEALVTAIAAAVVGLVDSLENTPTTAQVEALIRAEMVKASDLDMQAEFPGQKP